MKRSSKDKQMNIISRIQRQKSNQHKYNNYKINYNLTNKKNSI